MKKTVIYIRQSLDTDKQPNSLNMQKIDCLNYAKNKGWLIDEIYDEGYSSARKTDIEERYALSRLLRDVENGSVRRVLVFKRDRLARNVPQYLQIMKQLRESEVDVHFTAGNEPPLFTGSTGDFMEAILAGFSQHEGDNIVRRIQYSMIHLALDGKWVAGTQPYGYNRIKLPKEDMKRKEIPNLEFDKEKVEVIRTLFRTYMKADPHWLQTEKFGVICKELRENPKLMGLDNKQIWTILNQPLYKGLMVQWLGEVRLEAETPHFTIIDSEDWEQVHEIIEGMIKKPYDFKGDMDEENIQISPPLLKGKLFCGICKGQMRVTQKCYKCTTCNLLPRIDIVNKSVYEKVLEDLQQKAKKDWNLLKETIKKQIIDPAEKIIKQKAAETEGLKEQIKYAFQQKMLNSTVATDAQLKDLIHKYMKATAVTERASRQHVGMTDFADGLNHEEVLTLVKAHKLNNYQVNQLFTLVSKVIYHKKSYDISFSPMEEIST